MRDNPSYRLLWLGQVASFFGDWFNWIATAVLLERLTGSALAVGVLLAVRMLAPFLITPFAGVAADRYDRQRLLVLTDLGRAVVVLGLLTVRTPADVPLLYLLTTLQFALSGVFVPARDAFLPSIVRDGELGTANALSGTTWSVMLFFGAAAGGLVTGAVGVYAAFAIDAVTFVASALLLARITPVRAEGEALARGLAAALGQYVDGLRYLGRTPDVLLTATLKLTLALTMSSASQVALVPLAQGPFALRPEAGGGALAGGMSLESAGGLSLGLMYAALGLGSGLGPILSRHVTGDRQPWLRAAVLVAFVVAAVGLLLVAGAVATYGPGGLLPAFSVLAVGLALSGFGGGTIWVFSTQLLLENVPDRVRGRVFATEFALYTLGESLAAAAGGWLLEVGWLDIVSLHVGLAVLTVVPALIWWRRGLRVS